MSLRSRVASLLSYYFIGGHNYFYGASFFCPPISSSASLRSIKLLRRIFSFRFYYGAAIKFLEWKIRRIFSFIFGRLFLLFLRLFCFAQKWKENKGGRRRNIFTLTAAHYFSAAISCFGPLLFRRHLFPLPPHRFALIIFGPIIFAVCLFVGAKNKRRHIYNGGY